MTRTEEIEMAWFAKGCQSNHRYDEKTFREAVEWADKTMIEKACEWLNDNMRRYAAYDFELVEDLRKAMEE